MMGEIKEDEESSLTSGTSPTSDPGRPPPEQKALPWV
ncbi:hypothetical protein CFIO01_13353, partial [Colletotrichum fioriniae PJ7]